MESRAKILGHPIHPMLIPFPFGLLATSVIFDFIAAIGGYTELHVASYWMIGAGVISGLIAAIPGTIDLLGIPRGTRAWYVGIWHGVGNVAMLVLFAISWLLRRELPLDPGAIPIAISVIAFGIAGVTGWLGGELVDRMGIGVDPGAHPNSPSSLSGGPASAQSDTPRLGRRRTT